MINVNEKANIYSDGDVGMLAFYVDEVEVDELDKTKSYQLVKHDCDNENVFVLWNDDKKSVTFTPVNVATSCSLYFTESDIELPYISECTSTSTDLRCTLLNAESEVPADNVNSTYVLNATPGINFAAGASNTNGKGLYYTTNLSKTEDTDKDGTGDVVFFYRGAVENNYLSFAGLCWRIMRINEDGSVRLRYNGTMTNGACITTGNTVSIASSGVAYNTSYNSESYLGYTYGTSNTSSKLKSTIDSWYSTKINNNATYKALVADSLFCNDIQMVGVDSSYEEWHYGAFNRVYNKNGQTAQYKCPNAANNYSYKNTLGNQKLTYPVATITADDILYAGTNGYLRTANSYWTMSAGLVVRDTSYAHMFTYSNTVVYHNSGGVNYTSHYAMPVLSVIGTATVTGGSGKYNDPYVISGN